MANEILKDSELDQVAGGTFTANKYEKFEYNDAGLKTQYHTFDKDEFWAKDNNGDWKRITYDQANWAVNYYKHHNHTQPGYELIMKEAG